MIETAVEEDEKLMEDYLNGKEPSERSYKMYKKKLLVLILFQ